nr:MAG TPA: hypothetical protein [Caudoviricetes sp.]
MNYVAFWQSMIFKNLANWETGWLFLYICS